MYTKKWAKETAKRLGVTLTVIDLNNGLPGMRKKQDVDFIENNSHVVCPGQAKNNFSSKLR